MNRLLSLILSLFITIGLSCGVAPPIHYGPTGSNIKIIYPKQDQTIGAVDSTFIFGNVMFSSEKDYLLINGAYVPIHNDGGFLAFLPIKPGEFEFHIEHYSQRSRPGSGIDKAQSLLETHSLCVFVPEPLESVPTDTLAITGEYQPPIGNLVLSAGDLLELSFSGTPGCKAYASIAGISDSIPMTESLPRLQPYWGESVFGGGAVPDSMKIRGIYTGQINIPPGLRVTDVPVVYHLPAPGLGRLASIALKNPSLTNHLALVKYMAMPDSVTLESSWLLTTNSSDFPFMVRFSDSTQIIRHQPGRGYYSIFQPEGVEALAVGSAGDWFKLKLSETQFAYCEKEKVETYPVGSLPPRSFVRSIRTHSYDDSVQIEIALSGRHIYQVVETGRRTLSLRLFGVTTDTDWIRYDAADSLIDYILWSQPEPGWYELQINLTDPVWGYEGHYVGNSLILTLNRSPRDIRQLKGKRIIIDPGHSSDAGARGPTGLTEAEANLGIALVLEKKLKRAGAEVIMTRNDMSHLELYDRPAIAKTANADLFISIHNNALPDGVNPFENNGVSTYYYHLHSLDLARAIQKRMVEGTGAVDHGLYHGNLAVNRPTQYPAVLVECAFMMIPEQEAALKTNKYRKKVATAIMRGIEDFLKQYDREANDD